MSDFKNFTKNIVMFSDHVNLYTASKASLIKTDMGDVGN